MLMDAVRWMRKGGLAVELMDPEVPRAADTRLDAILELCAGDTTVTFAVQLKRRAPYPNELPRLHAQRQALARAGQPLLVVPFASEALGTVLTEDGWSWADAQGNFDLRAPSLMLRQRRTIKAPTPKRVHLPQGPGSLGIIRSLIRFGSGGKEAGGATSLAAQARVSQPRASQVLHQLQELNLVEKFGRGPWRPDREALLDHFLAEYSGPRGSEQFFYSLDSPTDVAVRAARAHRSQNTVVVSADVGPDLIVAWRRPSVVVLYAKKEIIPTELGVVEALGRDDANVIIRMPDDHSIFPFHELAADVRNVEVPLADPAQMIWDLQELGGADRLQGAGALREWLLKPR